MGKLANSRPGATDDRVGARSAPSGSQAAGMEPLGGMLARTAFSLGCGPLHGVLSRTTNRIRPNSPNSTCQQPVGAHRVCRTPRHEPPRHLTVGPDPGLYGTLPLSTQLHTAGMVSSPRCWRPYEGGEALQPTRIVPPPLYRPYSHTAPYTIHVYGPYTIHPIQPPLRY